MELCQDVSVVRLHDVLLESLHDVLRGLNNDAPSVRLHDISVVRHQTANDISVVRYQEVSVVRIHGVPLLRLCDVSCKSQLKHPITLQWYVSTTLLELRCCDGLYVFKLLCHELSLAVFHVSFKYQVKHQIFLVPIRRKTIRIV